MPYSIITRDGIQINNIPDDIPSDSEILKSRVAEERQRLQIVAAQDVVTEPSGVPGGTVGEQRMAAESEIPMLDTAGNVITPLQAAREPEQDPEFRDKLLGAAEVLATVATGATGGTVGMVGGTLKGLAEQILSGQFGTPEAARLIEQEATETGAEYTRMPKTQVGQEYLQAIAEPLSSIPAFIPAAGPVGAIPAMATSARTVTAPRVAERIRGAIPQRQAPEVDMVEDVGLAPTLLQRSPDARSVGAAQVPVERVRRETAAQMPVPFEGPTGLTKGQATRDFAELQFEKETAKLAEIGEPLRERVQAQSARFIDNFDALIDLSVPIEREVRGIGVAVDQAVTNKAEVQRKRISDLYIDAQKKGETEELVQMDALVDALNDVERFSGVSPNVASARAEALRLGAAILDDEGNLVAQKMSVNDAEILRQFVNTATDWTDTRQSTMGKKIKNGIDESTDPAGGEIYQKSRAERKKYADEFENVGLTAKMLGTKGKTDERAIAFEDVFNKIIILSPVEEMNKMRRTLLKAGPDGKQAWANLKAQAIAYIKEKSLSQSQRDAAGNPTLSPDALQKVVQSLDRAGKLESLFGKKVAQQLRDLAELATEIYTAPQGAVNYSNTASAITNAVDTVLTYGISGMPIAGRAVLKESLDYIKNRKLKARIREALKEPTE